MRNINFKNILYCFAINILWLGFIITVMHWLFTTPTVGLINSIKDGLFVGQAANEQFAGMPRFGFFLLCISAPLTEEVVFRWLPLTIASKCDRELFLPIVFASSIIFGFMHGSAINIWIQGVFGLTNCYLYFLNKKSYASCVILHSMWNFFLAYLVFIIAQ